MKIAIYAQAGAKPDSLKRTIQITATFEEARNLAVGLYGTSVKPEDATFVVMFPASGQIRIKAHPDGYFFKRIENNKTKVILSLPYETVHSVCGSTDLHVSLHPGEPRIAEGTFSIKPIKGRKTLAEEVAEEQETQVTQQQPILPSVASAPAVMTAPAPVTAPAPLEPTAIIPPNYQQEIALTVRRLNELLSMEPNIDVSVKDRKIILSLILEWS